METTWMGKGARALLAAVLALALIPLAPTAAYAAEGGAYAAASVARKASVTSPKATTLRSLKAVPGGFKATWKAGAKKSVTGYQIRYSKYRDLSAAKTIKVRKRTTTSAKLKKFPGSSHCFAQVRTYARGKDGKIRYSAWSKKKQVIGALNSGDAKLNANVKALIKRFGTGDGALRRAFNYVVNLRYKAGRVSLKGDWSVAAAKRMYAMKAGNCYGKAALLGWVAKGLGYNAKPVAGKLVNTRSDGTSTTNPHGWVEVKWRGRTLYCDPDTTKTMKDYGVKQVRGYSTYLYLVKAGQPYTYRK